MRLRFLFSFALLVMLVSSLVATHAQSGQVRSQQNAGTLTLLHSNDGESSLLPLQYSAPRTGGSNLTLDVGSTSALKTLIDQQTTQAQAAGNAVVNVYAGDVYLASSTLTCSTIPNAPFYDAVAQRQMSFDAHIIGNHEFDFTPDLFQRFVREFAPGGLPAEPFLSSNLDFSPEPGFADLIDADGLIQKPVTDGRVVGRAAIVEKNGQIFGIVGASPPDIVTLTSLRDVDVRPNDTPTLTETAAVIQPEIDRLRNDFGVQKIIFASQLQAITVDRALVKLLRGVDIAIAGGGNELLLSTSVPTTTQRLPGETASRFGEYPLRETDADGRTVYIVTTPGNYKYLGRLDVRFDEQGEIPASTGIITETSYLRRVIPTSQNATTLGLQDAVQPDPGIVATVDTPIRDCLRTLGQTVVARTEVALDVSRDGVRGRETNAGNLVTDSYQYAYDRLATLPQNNLPPRSATNRVIAVNNGGGIRQNAGNVLPVPPQTVPGTISRLNTLDVLPFANFVAVVQNVTPTDLKGIFERSAAVLPGGQFLQVSDVNVVYNPIRAVGSRVVSVTLKDGTVIVRNGAVVAGGPNVTVVTNDFTANGGDDYPQFRNNPNKTRLRDANGQITYEQTFREYLQSFPQVDGVPTIPASDTRYRPGGEGRLTFLRSIFLPFITR